MTILTLFFQILPLGCLLGIYCFLGIIPAIQGYLGSILIQLIVLACMKKIRVHQILKYSLAITLPTLTLYTSNLYFFFSEISIYYFISGIILSIGMMCKTFDLGKYSELFKKIHEHKIAFTLSIILCFAVSIVNVWVFINYSLSTWVYFRVFGPLVFIILLPLVLGALFSFKYNKDVPDLD